MIQKANRSGVFAELKSVIRAELRETAIKTASA
jgi:hypothetical protein